MSRVFICTVEFEHGREYKFALKVPTMEYIEEINEKIDDSSDVSNHDHSNYVLIFKVSPNITM